MTLSMVPVHQQRKEGDCAFLLLGRDSDSVHLEYLLWCSITDTGVNALEVREVMEPITPPICDRFQYITRFVCRQFP
jgi:hypothetical protein